jgi:ATP-binding cassette subfamily B protein/subfamily B ATP-binding cassette protein MsbA
MKNFIRALRFAWPYRWRFTASVACALLAALFWSLNFTAVYPILKIFSSDQNLQEWVESAIFKLETEQIAPVEKEIEDLNEQMKRVEKEPSAERRESRRRGITRDLAKYEARLVGFRQEVYRLQWMKKFIDMLFPRDKFQTLAVVMLLICIAVAIKGVFEFGQETLVGNVVFLSLFDLRNRFYRRVLNQDLSSFSSSADYMSRFTSDIDVVGIGMKTLLGRVIAEPLKALACVVFACWISWQLTFMFLVLVPIAGFVLTSVGRMMKRATKRVLEHMSHINQILQETFLGIRIIKAFGREPAQRRKFHEATRDHYYRNMRVVTLDAVSGPIIEIMGAITIVTALLAGAHLVLNKQTHLLGIRMSAAPLEMESLLQLYALLAAIADPVRKLSSVYTKIQGAFAGSDRIFKVMDREPKITHRHDGPKVPRHCKSIEFENVCFSYEPGHPVLSNVSLRVPHGQIVALVGKNGSGKSTLLNLLPRFFDPDHGAIYIDGVELRTANLRSLRKQIGIVTQDTFLFADTVFNNIAFGKPTATPQEVEEAARGAQAHEFIAALPNGYQTRLNEMGQKLSGGQKQKIALARAILADPSILILDEFTSAADAESELELHRILKGFLKGRTCFVITHRLNTLEIADHIVVLDEHRIIAEGNHSELIKTCPLYMRLHEAHFHRKVA